MQSKRRYLPAEEEKALIGLQNLLLAEVIAAAGAGAVAERQPVREPRVKLLPRKDDRLSEARE
jgi:hypothetical protein